MSDLINRRKIARALNRQAETIVHNGEEYIRKHAALELVRMSPSMETVEVVRCGECVNRGTYYSCPMRKLVMPVEGPGSYEDCTEDMGFCHLGKRREGSA